MSWLFFIVSFSFPFNPGSKLWHKSKLLDCESCFRVCCWSLGRLTISNTLLCLDVNMFAPTFTERQTAYKMHSQNFSHLQCANCWALLRCLEKRKVVLQWTFMSGHNFRQYSTGHKATFAKGFNLYSVHLHMLILYKLCSNVRFGCWNILHE